MKVVHLLTEKRKRAKQPAFDPLKQQAGPKLSLYDLNRIRLRLKAGEVPASLKRQAE